MQAVKKRINELAQLHGPVVAVGESGSGRTTALHVLHYAGTSNGRSFVNLKAPAWIERFNLCLKDKSSDEFIFMLQSAQHRCFYLGELMRLTDDQQECLSAFLSLPQIKALNLCFFATLMDMEGLDHAVRHGRLSRTLANYFRAGQIRVPPLRDHVEDIPELLEYHAEQLHHEENLDYRHFTVASQNLLRYHHWPGNIAELRALIRLVLATGQSTEVKPTETEDALHSIRLRTDCGHREFFMGYEELFEFSLKDARERFERAYLGHWITEMDGNISRLAEHAGVERTHLYRKLRALGIEPCKERRKRS